MIELTPPPYAFIIDTDSYAGNFEREMCAYVTGVIGECTAGADVALIALEELGSQALWFEEHAVQVPDDHGCHRPTSMWNNTGDTKFHSVAIFLDAIPNLKLMADRARAFVAKPPGLTGKFELGPCKILGFRLTKMELRTTTHWEEPNA